MIDEIQIQNWLADEGMFRQRIHDDNNFHFLINFPQDNSMDIFQPKGRNDLLIIGCATQVSPMEQDIIHNSKKSKNQEFIWDLRFDLDRYLNTGGSNLQTHLILKSFAIHR